MGRLMRGGREGAEATSGTSEDNVVIISSCDGGGGGEGGRAMFYSADGPRSLATTLNVLANVK